ncbi:TraB/GumN family protein [Natranaerofaba carboxydovora]|uniref:TraB/GumN family protein n=1 Tax=Natranaerofaba carboxydovora TaxID=2742683 RepID=UPI001F128F9B|nr:TraB/GumN family protein [Natranaerofaba carboxydovora]UMZ72565.1 TraB family protein [Natranaerofaba carboxydovora]
MKKIYKLKISFLITLLVVMTLATACVLGDKGLDKSKGIFYEVSDGNNKAYLFGSVHVGYEDMYPLDDTVYDVFDESEVLALEVDLTNITDIQIGEKFAQYGMYHDGRQMTDIVSEDTFEEVSKLVQDLGINPQMLNQFKPWYAGLIVSEISVEKAGLSEEYGVENYFIEKAEDEDMKIIGLETVSDQIAPYTKLSSESQVLYLEETLDEVDEAEENLGELIDFWKKGKTDIFEESRYELIYEAKTDSLGEYQKAMMDGRDKEMAGEISEILEEEDNYFLVVGSLHLAGDNSIVCQLRDKGYEVENVY